MKELSIEEKAKRYDEALERAKNTIEVNQAIPDIVECVESLFPELAESGDEEIRKALIRYFTLSDEHAYNEACGVSYRDIVAWLEKQDYTFEIKRGHWYKCVCDYMLNSSDLMFKNDRLYYCRRDWRLIGEIDERNVKDIGVNGYKSFFRPATNQEIKDWLELKGKQNPIKDHDICDTCDEKASCVNPCPVKLIEQKPTDKVEPKFRIGDVIEVKPMKCHGKIFTGNPNKIIDITEESYILDDGKAYSIELQDGWKLSEQNIAWTEEDENMIADLTIIIDTYFSEISGLHFKHDLSEDKISSWFKSLKARYTWTPSNEQIDMLAKVCSTLHLTSGENEIMESLYDALKKLKG